MLTLLIRLSIEKGGNEVFSYDPKKPPETLIDPSLISGFFEAVRSSSTSTSQVIQKIQFFNMVLYSRVHEKYTLRFLVGESMDEEDILRYFEEIDKQLVSFPPEESAITKAAFQAKLEQILLPLTEDPLSKITSTMGDLIKQETTPKITLVGLTQAGKTSIKYRFFENWSKALAKDTKPTVGADLSHHFQEFLLHKVVVLDLGGQSSYRNLYLDQDQEGMWKEIAALIFIVDIQNIESFVTARNYLIDIWRIVSTINEKNPTLSIFMHKYDPEKRTELNENVRKCLDIFKDFTGMSNLYLTTVEDSSSNLAMIKALYHSLPEVVIIRLLEKDFLDYFEVEILPQFTLLAKRLSIEGYNEVFQDLKPEIRNNAVKIGAAYGLYFQKIWLIHLMGEPISKRDKSLSDSIIFNLEKNGLLISIKNWTDQNFPEELTTLLLDGILEGVLKTLHMDPPEIVERNDYTTWKVNI